MLGLIYILTELQSITAVTAKQISRTGIKHGSFRMKYWFARLASESEKEEEKKGNEKLLSPVSTGEKNPLIL